MTVDAEQVPERHWQGGEAEVGKAQGIQPRLQSGAHHARHAQPGHVAFHIGDYNWHAGLREAFYQAQYRHRFAGAGGTSDQAVAVAELQRQGDGAIIGKAEQKGVSDDGGHGSGPKGV